jgi:hypothetical protein
MWTLAIAVLVGAAAAFTYFFYLLQSQIAGSGERILTVLYLAVVFSIGAYLLLFRFVLPRLRPFSRRARMAWGIMPFLTGTVLLLAVPVHLPSLAAQHQLEIVATGQKNPAAHSSEVWVAGLFLSDGTRIDASHFEMDGNWEVRDGVPLSYQKQPAVLRWQGAADGEVRLRLLSHSWSGIATITWDGVSQTIDLYAEPGVPKDIALQVEPLFSWLSAVVFLADIISLGMIILVLSVWLATRPIQVKPNQVKRWSWLGYALVCAIVWIGYLLAFWPALLTFDSIAQWQQMLTGQLHDAHPVFHTITNWAITRLWLSPTMVAVAQIIVLSVVTGLILTQLRKWGASRIMVWSTCFLFALSPANGILMNAIWKDIPYSIAVLILTYFTLRIVHDHGAWLNGRFAWVWLGLVTACVALYRHNGAPVAIGTLIVLFFAYRRNWKRLAAASTLMLGMWLGIRGPVYQWLNVQPLPSNFFTAYIALKHVAAHLAQGAEVTEAEQAFLRQVRAGDLAWPYLCSTAEPLLYDGKLDSDFALSHSTELVQLAVKLFQQNPRVDIEDQICSGSLVWRLSWPPTAQHWYNLFPFTIGPDGLPYTWKASQGPNDPLDYTPHRIESPVPAMTQFLTQTMQQMVPLDNISWLWRPALYLYLALAGTIIATIRSRYWKFLLVCIPIGLNSLMIVMTLAQDFRYQYPVVLVGLLFSIYLLFGIPLADRSPDR